MPRVNVIHLSHGSFFFLLAASVNTAENFCASECVSYDSCADIHDKRDAFAQSDVPDLGLNRMCLLARGWEARSDSLSDFRGPARVFCLVCVCD